MSKKEGAVFSKSLFGYKKRDVNEFIRNVDATNFETVKEYETLVKELREELTVCRSEIKKLSEENISVSKRAEIAERNYADKLSESEARGRSYLKLADAASQRAETAESRASELLSELEAQRKEDDLLKEKIQADEKMIAQLNADLSRHLAHENKSRVQKVKLFKFRRPGLFGIVRK